MGDWRDLKQACAGPPGGPSPGVASWPPWEVLGDWPRSMTREEEGVSLSQATAGRAIAGDPAQALCFTAGDTEARRG